jgi:hypothetical protein
VVSGRADVLLNITSLTLAAADLSSHTSRYSVVVRIPYPAGVTASIVTARVTYLIAPNPVQTTPTPSP